MHGCETKTFDLTKMYPPVLLGPGGEYTRDIRPKPYFTRTGKIILAITITAVLAAILFSIANFQFPIRLPKPSSRSNQPATTCRGGGFPSPYPAPVSQLRIADCGLRIENTRIENEVEFDNSRRMSGNGTAASALGRQAARTRRLTGNAADLRLRPQTGGTGEARKNSNVLSVQSTIRNPQSTIDKTEADLGSGKGEVSLHLARSRQRPPARSDSPLRIVDPSGLAVASCGLPIGKNFFVAIRTEESRDGKVLVGDGGLTRGDYHISRAYWQDACEQGGVDWDYDIFVWSNRHCEQIMTWYWQRHCPNALKRGDMKTLARIHNGGPKGDRKTATLEYWQRIQKHMAALAETQRW